MTENTKIPTAQNTIQDPPEYNTEKQDSDWLGGPQNGDQIPGNGSGSGNGGNGDATSGGADYTKHRFDATTGESYQQNGQSWLGGPQNGDETPREAARNPQTGDIQKLTEAGGNVQGVDTQTGSQAKGMGFTGPLNFAVGGPQDV